MKYQTLLNMLKYLPPERLQDDVTLYDEELDEYFPIIDGRIQSDDDVLDDGHFYLVIE